jgi:hypothetical protein
MNKLIPAEVFIINKMEYFTNGTPPSPKDVEEWLIEFAKIHVIEALKIASEEMRIKAISNDEGTYVVRDKDSVLKAYSLDNIN